MDCGDLYHGCCFFFFLPALIFVMVIIAAVNVYYGTQFVSTSRDLKRLDSVTRSPHFTQFSEVSLELPLSEHLV